MTIKAFSIRCLIAACLCIVAGCGHAVQSEPPPPAVKTATATQRTVHPAITLSGIIAPLQNVAITTALQEPTEAVFVNEGDPVKAGEVLARLNTADLSANANQASAHLEQTQYQANLSISQGGDQVRSAQAALAQAKSNLNLAQANLQRDEQLLAQGYIAQQAVDTQRTLVDVGQKQVVAAQAALSQAIENQQANGTQSQGMQRANVDQASAALQQIQAQIGRADIVSPINGVVVNRNLNPGEYPGTRQIFTLQEVDNVYAELNAFGSQVASIGQGAATTLVSPAVPQRTFAGRVVAILSPTSPNSASFIVKVKIPNEQQMLRPGMTVTAKVSAPARSGIAVPVNAFLDDTHQTVMTVHDGTAHVSNVAEVAEDQNWAVVTGLPAGSVVIANGQAGVADGQKVAVR
jgi:HlyD family secretion protein